MKKLTTKYLKDKGFRFEEGGVINCEYRLRKNGAYLRLFINDNGEIFEDNQITEKKKLNTISDLDYFIEQCDLIEGNIYQ